MLWYRECKAVLTTSLSWARLCRLPLGMPPRHEKLQSSNFVSLMRASRGRSIPCCERSTINTTALQAHIKLGAEVDLWNREGC